MLDNDSEPIVIPLSKKKITLLFLGAIAFVILGIWFLINPETFTKNRHQPIIFITTVGFAATIFFGLCAIFILKKFWDKKAGIIIDSDGISDNSSGVSAGLIPWSDIRDIKIVEIAHQKLIMVVVKDPKQYIDRQSNFIAKRAAAVNHKLYGTPISLNIGSLKYKFDDLYYMLLKRWQHSKENMPNP